MDNPAFSTSGFLKVSVASCCSNKKLSFKTIRVVALKWQGKAVLLSSPCCVSGAVWLSFCPCWELNPELWGGGRHLSPCLPACFYLMERCEPPETVYGFCNLITEFSLAWSTEWVSGQPELHRGTPSWKTNQPNRRMGFVSQYYQEGLPSTVWKQGVLLPHWCALFFPRKPDL